MIGTLLPFNSLVSRKYPQDLFASAKLFIDWLEKTGQNIWQILPLSMSGDGHSPYFSYGIGLDPQYLPKQERLGPYPVASKEFCEENQSWLPDYCRFMSIREKYGTDHWYKWPKEAINIPINPKRSQFFQDQQAYVFAKFLEVRKYAADHGVQLWGDIPFYLPINSPLVWRYPEAFLIEKNGSFSFVAGSYGDTHFISRQTWGFPLYQFEDPTKIELIKKVWQLRLGALTQILNKIRLDAAIRFFVYEKLDPYNQAKDQRGVGPGEDFLASLVNFSRVRGTDLFVEDISGLDMVPLYKACDHLGVSTISVLTMILAPHERTVVESDFDMRFLPSQIYYTSSHDAPPVMAYLKEISPGQREVLIKLFNLTPSANLKLLAADLRKAMIKRSTTLVVALQDWLLTTDRINVPGTISPTNWQYKMTVPVEDLPDVGKD